MDNQEKLQWTQGQGEEKSKYRGKSHFADWINDKVIRWEWG